MSSAKIAVLAAHVEEALAAGARCLRREAAAAQWNSPEAARQRRCADTLDELLAARVQERLYAERMGPRRVEPADELDLAPWLKRTAGGRR